MEYKLSKEKITVSLAAFNGCKEQPIDIDLTLPDYCPDVRRVLKCKVTPMISSKALNGDTLEIDGTVVINVLYTDPDCSCVRCYEHNLPFNTVLNIKNPPSDCIVFTSTKTEYINCRALTPRRLDLHGAFSICAKVVTKVEKEIVTGVDGDDIQQKIKAVPYTSLLGMGQQLTSISEDTPLTTGKPPVETVIRKDCKICITDVKLIPDKAMVKGDVWVKLLYVGDIEKGTTEQFEYSVPFNRIVDISGLDEDCICYIDPEINSVAVAFDFENNNLSSDIKLTLSVLAYKKCETHCVSDTYSMKYDMQTATTGIYLPKICAEISDTLTEKTTLNFSDRQITSIIDLWCDNTPPLTLETVEGKPVLRGKLPINMIAVGADDDIFFAERSVDVAFLVNTDSNNDNFASANAEVSTCVAALSYRLNGGDSIDLRADIKLDGLITEDIITEYVSAAEANENTPPEKDRAAVVLYYTEKDESLWDIAKKYKTSLKSIAEENELGDKDRLDKGVLVLPV